MKRLHGILPRCHSAVGCATRRWAMGKARRRARASSARWRANSRGDLSAMSKQAIMHVSTQRRTSSARTVKGGNYGAAFSPCATSGTIDSPRIIKRMMGNGHSALD